MRRLATAILGGAAALLASGALAQQSFPPIESIDVYGLRTVSEERLRALLPFHVGDVLTDDPQGEDIAAALGVAQVEFAAVCCGNSGGTQIYVGVQEEQAEEPSYRPPPQGDVRLPDDVMAAYNTWTQALLEAVRAGQAQEDHSEGHALSAHPGMRAEQERFIAFAARDRDLLIEVLNNSSDPQHRGVAAHVLGYASDKSAIVDELARAMFDSHELVRNNAIRAVMVLADYANQTPDTGIVIDPQPYLVMLDSIVWSDRNKSSALLGFLTQSRDPALMAMLSERSMPALVEMCGWSTAHGEPACLMLQRVLGLPDDASMEARPATLAAAAALLEADAHADGG